MLEDLGTVGRPESERESHSETVGRTASGDVGNPISVESFSERLGDSQLLRFQIWFLRDSYMIWASDQGEMSQGSNPRAFESLAIAFPPRPGSSTSGQPAASSRILAVSKAEPSETIARHLARRLNVPVYASIQVSSEDLTTRQLIEQRLLRAILRHSRS
mmetsp:Transcript_2003/g.3556  ORF Transcript_2003/g.3556 Transcript_2003/m.3556 type:complete len:160 (-) Transcript_2003:32-511(-)